MMNLWENLNDSDAGERFTGNSSLAIEIYF